MVNFELRMFCHDDNGSFTNMSNQNFCFESDENVVLFSIEFASHVFVQCKNTTDETDRVNDVKNFIAIFALNFFFDQKSRKRNSDLAKLFSIL